MYDEEWAQALLARLNTRENETHERKRVNLQLEHENGAAYIAELAELSGWSQVRCLQIVGRLAELYQDLSWSQLAFLAKTIFVTNRQLDDEEAAKKGKGKRT